MLLLTDGRQLVLHLQDDALAHILQQADDLVVSQSGQVDAVHRLDEVAHIELVAPGGGGDTVSSAPWGRGHC